MKVNLKKSKQVFKKEILSKDIVKGITDIK